MVGEPTPHSSYQCGIEKTTTLRSEGEYKKDRGRTNLVEISLQETSTLTL